MYGFFHAELHYPLYGGGSPLLSSHLISTFHLSSLFPRPSLVLPSFFLLFFSHLVRSKGNNIEICHKAIDFYIEYSPMELNDMLVFLVSRLDHIRVVNQISRTSNCPTLPGRVSGYRSP